MVKLRFSGHESFQCRNMWPKKGFDLVQNEIDFNSDQAVLSLGVGKNMTTSIRYWMNAMGLRKSKRKERTFNLEEQLLSDDGWDPYLEDIGSLWLLHYQLVSTNFASIYHLVFNHFRKHRTQFTKKQLLAFIKNKSLENGKLPADSTLETDIGVFIKTYLQPNSRAGEKNIEDHFSSLLMELNLIKEIDVVELDQEKKQTWYQFEQSNQDTLPVEIFLYAILVNENFTNSITFQDLLNYENSPGSVFLLSPDSLISKIEELTYIDEKIVYTDDGGIRLLQITEDINPEEVLAKYYGRG